VFADVFLQSSENLHSQRRKISPSSGTKDTACTRLIGESSDLSFFDLENDEKRQNPQNVMRSDCLPSVIELFFQLGIAIWDCSTQMVTNDIRRGKKAVLLMDFEWSKSYH
jgi:hypothetical protein